jgi:ribonuclease HI
MKKRDEKITIYTDGACDPNPGPGGWAALIIMPTGEKILSGGEPETTNNRMELTAAIQAIQSIKQPSLIWVYTDSQYLQKGIEEWIEKWLAKNWKGSSGKVANQDLWKELLFVIQPHQIKWHWLRGHFGNVNNHRVDQLAKRAIPK